MTSLFLVQNIFIYYIWINYHTTEIISCWLKHLLIVWISYIIIVLYVLSFVTLVHNCVCLISNYYLLFIIHYLIVVNNSSHFHGCCIIVTLRCISWATLKTISQLRTINTACIHTPYIHLHSTLQLCKLVPIFIIYLVLKNSLGSKIDLIVDLHWTYAALCLIHLIVDINHLTSILWKWIVKWIIVLYNPTASWILCCAIYVYLIIINSTFIFWLMHLLLLYSLVVLVLWYNTFALILNLLLAYPLNHIFIWFLGTFPRLALSLEIYWLIHIISIILLYWPTLSSPIVVYLLKLLLINRLWIIMLLYMIRLILIELSFWWKNIISIFFILIENTLLLLLLWHCPIIIFLYEYLVWCWIILI